MAFAPFRGLPERDLLSGPGRGGAIAADGLRGVGGQGRDGAAAVGVVIRRRGSRRRAHAAGQPRGFRSVGSDPAHVRRRRATRPVRRDVRPDLAVPAVHGADRRHRAVRPRRPRRLGHRTRGRPHRRPDGRLDADRSTRWKTSPPRSAIHPGSFSCTRPPTASWPPAWCSAPKRPASRASSSRSTPGSRAGARAT